MRFAPYPAPSKAELDRVKRVLFPAEESTSQNKEEEFHSLPLTGEGEEEGEKEEADEIYESVEEDVGDNMSKDDDGDMRKPKTKGKSKMESVFRLDPNVEVFNKQTKPKRRGRSASVPDEVSICDAAAADTPGNDAASAVTAASTTPKRASRLHVSPSPRRFEPPFKTPPSASIGARGKSSSPMSASQGGESKGERTPSYKTPPKSPEGVNGNERSPPKASSKGDSAESQKEIAESPASSGAKRSQSSDASPAGPPTSTGKRKLYSNKNVPLEELPSPKKKPPRTKLPKVQLKMRPLNAAPKEDAPKKEKRETAKTRAEAYRVKHRNKILSDMEKQKSVIGDLLERRRQKRSLQESQSQSPEHDWK